MKHQTLFEQLWFTWRVRQGQDIANCGEDEILPQWERETLAGVFLNLLDRERDLEETHKDIIDFYLFCRNNLAQSKAQIYQDLWVLFMTEEKTSGFFVEFGACDGIFMSNTWLLEKKYKWSGILAEPNPHWADSLLLNREAHIDHSCVYRSTGDVVEMRCVTQAPELSHVADIVPSDIHQREGNRENITVEQVNTISLEDLLRKYNAPHIIDYLSIDTEGSELEILQSFRFDRYDVRLISVEHAGDESKREAIRETLESRGFQRWYPELTRWDDWYINMQ
ncbi:FkbM family methyltransferase [Asaia sp. SF2.1]|nr:FkbM family methyltransferase [Asaia sp. SF2.1]ETC98202.1 methyltransferase [Asaia sp. SF2.1]